ncbi:nitrilase-related carbon-nitrogen hydrolase, partial [Rhizobium ruizarguesonis]
SVHDLILVVPIMTISKIEKEEVKNLATEIENGVFVIAAAQAGRHEEGRETFGHSMIIDPWGTVLASAGATGEAVIVAE